MTQFSQIKRFKHDYSFLTLILTFWLTMLFYASSIHFNFIWDDPVWYGHVVGKTWWQTLLPIETFQFYRPLSMLYIWLFQRPGGTFAIETLHWLQICWHTLNIALVYSLIRRLGLNRWGAVLAAGLFACLPFSYQAVAWAAPQQPLVNVIQNSAWLIYFSLRPINKPCNSLPIRHRSDYYITSLVLFVIALMIQESSVPLAFIPLIYEFTVRNSKVFPSPGKKVAARRLGRGWVMSLGYVLVAAIYGILWLQTPRQGGITSLALDGKVGLYLLQGIIYPILGRPFGYVSNGLLSPLVWLAWLLVIILLIGLAFWKNRTRLSLLALSWIGLSLAPAMVGLEFDYVSLASRLFYPSALGIILLWLAVLWPAGSTQDRRYWRFAGAAFLILVGWQSGRLLANFRQIYQRGTVHLNQAVELMSRQDGRYLFINFPDRYQPRKTPYPVGNWGLTLAPVVVDLADFLPFTTGREAESISRSMPWIDNEVRLASPYSYDLRGVVIQSGELYQLAKRQDVIYLTRYHVTGDLELQLAGSLIANSAGEDCLVVFEESICLVNVKTELSGERLSITSSWSTDEQIAPNITMFVHLGAWGNPPLVQADGDSWLGMLPLSDWQAGDLIEDHRYLAYPANNEELILQLGIYDRVDGRRWLTETGGDFYSVPIR